MSVLSVVGLRACCVAIALLIATARGAEQNPLIGATRDQVLSRYGEPKSQIESGNRVILLYPRERIILRDDVVIEVEPLLSDAPRRGSAGETPTAPPAATPTPAPPGTATTNPPAQSAPANQTPSTGSPPPAAPGPEPKFAIKLVRPPGSKDVRPTPATTPSSPRETVPPKNSSPSTPTTTSDRPASTPAPVVTEPLERAAPLTEVLVEPVAPSASTAEERKAEERAAALEKQKKAEALKQARQRLAEASMADATPETIPTRTYLYALLILAGGIGYFVWRYRQRQLELAATSVVNTPLAPPAATPAMSKGRIFTAEQLNKMAWSRFEELVAEYYSKTGVVAARTKTGPDTPVHLKISWKGEPRPFAYVQCVAHPSGLIDAKPVQEFAAALAADDIRRGYVVTTGKFSVPARDLAEEKHITLLPGDIFLEKLNALPPKARAEIIQAIHAGE